MNSRHREIAILMGLIALVGFYASAHAYLQKSGDAARSEVAAIYADIDQGAQRSDFNAAKDVLDKEFKGTVNGQEYYRESLGYYYDKRTARGRGRARHHVTTIESMDVAASNDRVVAQVTVEEKSGKGKVVTTLQGRTDVWVRRDDGWKKLSADTQNTRYFVDGREIDRKTYMREYRPRHRGGGGHCKKPDGQGGHCRKPGGQAGSL